MDSETPETSPAASANTDLSHQAATAPRSGTRTDQSNAASLLPLNVGQALPFFVTQWLHQYQQQANGNEHAMQQIRHATAQLAAAFAATGAFGEVQRPALTADSTSHSHAHATFADLRRQIVAAGTTLANDNSILEALVQSAMAARQIAHAAGSAARPVRVDLASAERWQASLRHPASGGRTLQEAIALDDVENAPSIMEDSSTRAIVVAAAAQPPVLLQSDDRAATSSNLATNTSAAAPHHGAVSISVQSSTQQASQVAANALRAHWDLREKMRQTSSQIATLEKSVAYQRQQERSLVAQRSQVALGSVDGDQSVLLQDLAEQEQSVHRVLAQLERQLSGWRTTLEQDRHLITELQHAALATYQHARRTARYSDPLRVAAPSNVAHNNRFVFNAVGVRPTGMHRLLHTNATWPPAMGRGFTRGALAESERHVVSTRLSHAATINSHLYYPIYCLRFDRSGRYFITGADDFLARVFYLAKHVSQQYKRQVDPANALRGAVLVCSLRGHAGVVNDIDVSSDNCFLATASEDGDCRVWGLHDGCPIAILRGHTGGANMVSWSRTTPYRLVTTSADGLARTWDVRKACLKRYRMELRDRPDFRRSQQGAEVFPPVVTNESPDDAASGNVEEDAVALPPLPVRENAENDNTGSNAPLPPIPDAVPLPPLPPPINVNGGPQAYGHALNAGNNANPGQFVANDTMDEGVQLISKLQHGAALEDRLGGPGTRARRAAVKVICVARCPHGEHFATGSDDGICRIWRDDDDPMVAIVDRKASLAAGESIFNDQLAHARRRRHSKDALLLTLKGHLSAITDLQYSYHGDRLLTASQKDGVVRIWSWNTDPARPDAQSQATATRETSGCQTSHILIKLTNPNGAPLTSGAGGTPTARRRPNRNVGAGVSCDVAAWLRDDTRIMTSQCQLTKQNSSDIVPGSQYIFIWDSVNGHCLFGFSNAHRAQCPVLITHPRNHSMICSGGADGVVKLWDLESGRCITSHRNNVDYGAMEDARDKGKPAGLLDGHFSPDGTELVLTDDNGRIILFDCFTATGSQDQSQIPPWMREQYFANDYYELFYDANGYCVESGSQQPPHLAPRGVRCSHAGIPVADTVNDAFRKLKGPIPLSYRDVRLTRQHVGSASIQASKSRYNLRGTQVRQFDHSSTILFGTDGKVAAAGQADSTVSIHAHEYQTNGAASPEARAPRLSSNWRWRDYGDVLREESIANDGEEPDSDDEDFQLPSRTVASNRSGSFNDFDDEELLGNDEDDDDDDVSSDIGQSTRRSNRRARRTRVVAGDDEEDESSSGDELDEFMSSNNTPSGPFTADYDSHFFRMPHNALVNRKWVRRLESGSGYEGRKCYTPQVGDEIIYIPRAHYETISVFPSLSAPWQNWPNEAVWPVVRCSVRNIRYRFPYQAFYSARHGEHRIRDIVAIITVEVTGIPELSRDRMVVWPKPAFVTPARTHMFDFTMVQSDNTDYAIPSCLYVHRLEQLERALVEAGQPHVQSYYADPNNSEEDPELIPFDGTVVEQIADEDDSQAAANLRDSGYQSLLVRWEDGEPEEVSPWEVAVPAEHTILPERPRITPEEKATCLAALNALKQLPGVRGVFDVTVNVRRYSDYLFRIEVPMDLEFIGQRLGADYYASRFSFVADVKLIHENSVKYNGEDDDLSVTAMNMVEKAKEMVLRDDERILLSSWEEKARQHAPAAARSDHAAGLVEVAPRPVAVTRSGRAVRPRSALELVGANEPPRRRRNSRTRRPFTRNSRISPIQTSRERAAPQDVPTAAGVPLDQIGARGRMTQNSRHERQNTYRRVLRSAVAEPAENSLISGHVSQRAARAAVRSSHFSTTVEEHVDGSRRSSRNNGAVAHLTTSSRASSRRVTPAEPERQDGAGRVRQQEGRRRPSDSQVESDVSDDDDNEAVDESSVGEEILQGSESDSPELSVAPTSDEEDEEDYEITPRSTIRASRGREANSRSRESAKRKTSAFSRVSHNGRSTRQRGESTTYAEPSDSEFDDESPEGNDGESSSGDYKINACKASGRARATKRKRPSASANMKRKAQKRRAKRTDADSEDGDDDEGDVLQPNTPERWPDIDLKAITNVCIAILQRLEELDEDEAFSKPVVEAFPNIARDYRKVVKRPMDFRTIKEERLPRYRSIAEFLDDLVLTFQNCIAFNGLDSIYGQRASLMLESLKEMFKDVCREKNVLLPRRW